MIWWIHKFKERKFKFEEEVEEEDLAVADDEFEEVWEGFGEKWESVNVSNGDIVELMLLLFEEFGGNIGVSSGNHGEFPPNNSNTEPAPSYKEELFDEELFVMVANFSLVVLIVAGAEVVVVLVVKPVGQISGWVELLK